MNGTTRIRRNAGYIKNASKYKYVYKFLDASGGAHWVFKFANTRHVECDTERDAALRVDKALIGKGKNPVNILKPKQ